MNNGVVALFTSDGRYANAFMDYGIRNEKSRISVKVFTNEESLEHAIRNEKIDLLLIDDLCTNDKNLSYECRIAFLSHERFVKQGEHPSIFIFQKAEMIFRQIYEILSEDGTEECIDCCCTAGSDMPEIIGVFSPCYPIEREEFARMTAAVIGEKHKTLFINLAEFTEEDYEDENGISELLFYIQQQGKRINYKLPALIKHKNTYSSLPGVKHYQDLFSIEEGDIERLMTQFSLIKNVEKVVVDIGFIGGKEFFVMKHCNRIYMPVNLMRSRKKHEHFLHDIHLGGKDTFMEKVEIINLPQWWEERKEMRNNWTRTVVNQ